jgi:hypothetical protein
VNVSRCKGIIPKVETAEGMVLGIGLDGRWDGLAEDLLLGCVEV